MIRFFKSQQVATLFIIPVIVLLLWAQSFFGDSFVLKMEGMPLQNLLMNILASFPEFVQVLFGIAFVSFGAIYLSILVNRHEVLYRNSYLPAFMYVLLMSCALPLLQFHPVILVNLIMMVVLDKTFILFKVESPVSPLFDSSFLISIASLLYFPAAVFFILFLMAVAMLRPFNIREWVIAFVGFLLPYFFLCVYFFWTDQFQNGWNQIIERFNPGLFKFEFVWSQPLLWLITIFSLLLLLSFYHLRQNFYKNVIRTRAYQQILFLYLFIDCRDFFPAAWFCTIVPVDHAGYSPGGIFQLLFFVRCQKTMDV